MSNNATHARPRGFSLIETMIAAALLGVIAAAVVMVLSFASREAGGSRLRTIAATNARETLDRIHFAVQVAGHHGFDDTALCSLLTSPGAPMDDASPATVTGACPSLASLTVAGIRIPETTLTRTVTVAVAGTPLMVSINVQIWNAGTMLVETATQVVRED